MASKSKKKSNSQKKRNSQKKLKTNKERELERERRRQEIKLYEEKKRKKLNLLTLVGYAIILIIVASHHELWRDEAQSWLISKNLGFIKIISQLKYEGHPFLWYFLLRVFAIFKLKYKYIIVIPVMLNLIATYVLLDKSKYNRFVNLVIMFSSGIFFYCGIITRSYALAYLLVVLLMFMYKDRYQKSVYYGLLLFMIMNTHILLLGFVGSLVLIDIYEFIKNKYNRRSIIISTSMVLVGLVTLVGQFCNTVSSTGKTIHFEYLSEIFSKTNLLFMPTINSNFLYVITLFILAVFVIYLVYKKEYKNLFILLCGVMFQILFATMIYNSMNAACLIYINILFVIMQFDEVDKFIMILVVIFFGATLYGTCLFVDNDYRFLFSDSENVAKYIKKNVDKGSKIYCELLDYCAAINAHLPENKYHFIDYNSGKEYTYTEYGDYLKILNDQTIYKTYEFFNKEDMDYYIGSINNKEILEYKDDVYNYELVYETTMPVFYSGEGYVVYKRK